MLPRVIVWKTGLVVCLYVHRDTIATGRFPWGSLRNDGAFKQIDATIDGEVHTIWVERGTELTPELWKTIRQRLRHR